MNTDIITHLGSSIIQHGKDSDRVYLMKLAEADYPCIIEKLDALAYKNGYSKIFIKVPNRTIQGFLENGYDLEASVSKLYKGAEDGCFLSKYLSPERKKEQLSREFSAVLDCAENAERLSVSDLPEGFRLSWLTPADAPTMARVYQQVFESYPFPIFSPAYLLETMEDQSVYLGVFYKENLVALASCEMDIASENVEMTDFATIEKYRSHSLANHLLLEMEKEMRIRGIKTAFTIARSISYGMNITFSRGGYTFSGRLRNNTNISGTIESMNVWYKKLL